ncbi:hypothetical protein EVAR_23485_1 [Eumeta japonica]|uniref:Mos1 transposase HTH domain-containing protein n=1 Tax=Eumeta variegata TaxID=151549 RepID=A0A4C1ULH5_EUMVA|nr:hypothetical protein EVAR_23485_1 [Eumeta japonica]
MSPVRYWPLEREWTTGTVTHWTKYEKCATFCISSATLGFKLLDEAPCKTTVYNWFAEFKRGRVNLSDEFRDDRPSTAVNNKNIDAVRRMIETDRHVTIHNIRAFLGIGISQIQSYTNL